MLCVMLWLGRMLNAYISGYVVASASVLLEYIDSLKAGQNGHLFLSI